MKTILLVVTFNLSGILIQWHFVREFVVHWHFVPDILSGGILLVIHRHASFKDFTVLYCYNSINISSNVGHDYGTITL